MLGRVELILQSCGTQCSLLYYVCCTHNILSFNGCKTLMLMLSVLVQQIAVICKEMQCTTYAGILVGAVVIHDKVKPEARQAIKCLQSMNVKVALLTGDNRRTALAIAQEVSIAYVLPGTDLHFFNRLEYQREMFVLRCYLLIRKTMLLFSKKGTLRLTPF